MRELIKSSGPDGASAVTELDGNDKSSLHYLVEVSTVHAFLSGLCGLFAFGVVASVVKPLVFEAHMSDPNFQI